MIRNRYTYDKMIKFPSPKKGKGTKNKLENLSK